MPYSRELEMLMRKIRRSVAATGFVLAALSLATTNLLASSGGDFREGQKVTVVLPATSFEEITKKKKNQPGKTYEVVHLSMIRVSSCSAGIQCGDRRVCLSS